MNFQLMNKQRKFVLISAAVGFISMFLPWFSFSMMGYSQSVNGMHDKGILVFLCFVATGVIAYMNGDQTKNLDKTMWAVTLLAGAIALLITIWYYSQASGSIMGSSFIGFGLYIAAIASIGILASAYIFRSSTDNLKDSFNSMKKDIESKIGNAGSTPPPSSPNSTIPPSGNTPDTENNNPPL
ncbi:MAG TPA: hypothetical protein VMU83_13440 [Hanamia sp.]|nr:hypothetical protein [Hanamia sp.]